MAEIKHITMKCPYRVCKDKAFVQVLVVDEVELQPEIDKRAKQKLRRELNRAHKEGLHG